MANIILYYYLIKFVEVYNLSFLIFAFAHFLSLDEAMASKVVPNCNCISGSATRNVFGAN